MILKVPIMLFLLIAQITVKAQENLAFGYNNTIPIDSIDLALIMNGILYETNQERLKRKTYALERNEHLDEAARLHSSAMNSYRFFNHINLHNKNLKTLVKRVESVNYAYQEIGENIYYGYIDKNKPKSYSELCKRIVNDLMKSNAHRKNIISRNFRDIGVAVVLADKKDPDYVYFYITQDFGVKANTFD